ncbi:24814_t:CDS:1, partial [Racocetra persica]
DGSVALVMKSYGIDEQNLVIKYMLVYAGQSGTRNLKPETGLFPKHEKLNSTRT